MTLVSVVIPTYERPRKLDRCLAALAEAREPAGGVEVVVVDDGGGIPLERVVDKYADRLDVTLVRQDNAGPAAARNAGAMKASGGLLAFTDDDCRVSPDWLVALETVHHAAPDAMIAGRTLNADPTDRYSIATELIVAHFTAWSQTHDDTPPFAASNNLAVPTDPFLELGGFDENFPLAAAEDRELAARWAAQGWAIRHADDAVIHHAHEYDLAGYVRQHHNYGRGARTFERELTADGLDPHLFKGLGFYVELLRRAVARGTDVAALVVLAQLASALGYLRQMLRL